MILDFGLSIDNRSKVNNFVGDIRYASPEVLKRIEYTEKSEMYSFGILLFYVLTGQYPFAYAKVSDPNYRLLHERKYNTFW
jgi:serine/threonine protein kinase